MKSPPKRTNVKNMTLNTMEKMLVYSVRAETRRLSPPSAGKGCLEPLRSFTALNVCVSRMTAEHCEH